MRRAYGSCCCAGDNLSVMHRVETRWYKMGRAYGSCCCAGGHLSVMHQVETRWYKMDRAYGAGCEQLISLTLPEIPACIHPYLWQMMPGPGKYG